MGADTASAPDGPAADPPSAARGLVVPASSDRRAPLRRATAIGAALLLHIGIIAAILIVDDRATVERPLVTPPIPVDLAIAPVPVPPSKTNPQPDPPSQVQAVRTSGGESDHAAGPVSDGDASPTRVPSSPAPARAYDARGSSEPATPPEAAAVASPPEKTGDVLAALPPQSSPNPPISQSRPSASAPQHRSSAEPDAGQSGKGGGDRYLNAVRREILRNRVYPPAARALGITGTAEYAIFLDRRGQLLRLRLLRSAGADMLDEAAMAMIKRSAPFPPLPAELTGDEIRLVVTLHIAP